MAGEGGILPMLGQESYADQVQRKNQYRLDLQRQVEEQKNRRQLERDGAPAVPAFGQWVSPDPAAPAAPRGFAEARPNSRGKKARVRPQAGNTAVPDPTGLPVIQFQDRDSTEIMQSMRRWEKLFTGQMGAAVEAVAGLNGRIVQMEEQLTQQSREKSLLRERVERGELSHQELQHSKDKLQQQVQEIRLSETAITERMSVEIRELKDRFEHQVSQQNMLLKQSTDRSETLQKRLHEQEAANRVMASSLASVQRELERTRGELSSFSQSAEAKIHSQTDTGNMMQAQLQDFFSRIETLEGRIAPDTQQMVDQSQKQFWSATRQEINGVRQDMSDLRSRIDKVDTEATSLLMTWREKSEAAAKRAESALSEANQNHIARFNSLEKALAVEIDSRVLLENKFKTELQSATKALSESILNADADTASLIEALHSRFVDRLSKQEHFSQMIQEALERKRVLLEEVVQAEIKRRNQSVELTKAEVLGKFTELTEKTEKEKAEVAAQVKLLDVQIRNANRGLKNAAAQVEEYKRNTESVHRDIDTQITALQSTQVDMEKQLKETINSRHDELLAKLDEAKSAAERTGTLSSSLQMTKDSEQDDKLNEIKRNVEGLSHRFEEMIRDRDRNSEEVGRKLNDLQTSHTSLKTSVDKQTAERDREFAALQSDLRAQMSSTSSKVDEFQGQFTTTVATLQAEPGKLFIESAKRVSDVRSELVALREKMEERCQEVEKRNIDQCAQLEQLVESQRMYSTNAQDANRAEFARIQETHKNTRESVETLQNSTRQWKTDTEALVKANHEEAIRVRELVSDELKQLYQAVADNHRETEVKFGRMDTKLTDDSRKVLQAISAHKQSVERLKKAIEQKLESMHDDEVVQLKKLWKALSEQRKANDAAYDKSRKAIEAESRARMTSDLELDGKIKKMRQELDQNQKNIENTIQLEKQDRHAQSDSVAEALNVIRQTMDQSNHDRQDDLDKIREEIEDHVEQLNNQIAVLGDKLHEEEGSRQRDFKGCSDSINALIGELKGVEAMHSSFKEDMKMKHGQMEAKMNDTDRAVSAEESARNTAIAAVYEKMEVNRTMESVLKASEEKERQEALQKLEQRIDTVQSAGRSELGSQLQEVQDELAALRSEDQKLGEQIAARTAQAEADNERAETAERLLSKEIESVKGNLAVRASDLQQAMEVLKQNTEQRLQDDIAVLGTKLDQNNQELEAKLAQESASSGEALAAKAQALQEEVSKLQQQRQDDQEATSASTGNLQKQIDAQKEESAQKQKDLKDSQTKLEGRLYAVETEAGDNTKELQSHDKRLLDLDGLIKALEKAQGDQAENLVQKISDARSGAASGEEELKARLDSLERNTSEKDAELEELINQSKTELEEKSAELDKKNMEKNSELEELIKQSNSQLEEARGGAATQEEALKARLEALEKATSEKDSELQEMISQSSAKMEEKSAALEKQTSEKDAELEELINNTKMELEKQANDDRETASEGLKKLGEKQEESEQAVGDQMEAIKVLISQNVMGQLTTLTEESEKRSQDLDDKITETNKKLDEVEEKVTNMSSSGEKTSEQTAADVAELKKQVAAVEEKANQVDDLSSRMEAVEGSYADKQRVEAVENTLSNIEPQLEQMEKDVQEAKQKAEELSKIGKEVDQVRINQDQYADYRKNDLTRIEANESGIKDLNKKIKDLEGAGISEETIASMEVITNLQSSVGELETKDAWIEGKLDEATKENTKRFDELKELTEQKASNEDVDFKVTTVKNEVDLMASHRKNDNQAAEEARGKLESRIKELEKKPTAPAAAEGPSDEKKAADAEQDALIEQLMEQTKKADQATKDTELRVEQIDAKVEALKNEGKTKKIKEDLKQWSEQEMAKVESALNNRIDLLKVDELRAVINTNSKTINTHDEKLIQIIKLVEDLGKDEE